jgi:hypothetical protein
MRLLPIARKRCAKLFADQVNGFHQTKMCFVCSWEHHWFNHALLVSGAACTQDLAPSPREPPALRSAASRDGAYLLRTNLEGSDPAKLWTQYIQLTEAVFRALKSDLAVRPIWHFTPKRVEAHLMVAFLRYCLWVCLKHKLKASAPSLSPWQLLNQFGRIQLIEVWFKLRAGGCICLERVTQPEAAQAALIHQLNWPVTPATTAKIYKADLQNVWTT